jgi:hypothetical protein
MDAPVVKEQPSDVPLTQAPAADAIPLTALPEDPAIKEVE